MCRDKYIAVTIGPIFDTINLASSPSALWAASYMFSMLSKNICIVLTEKGIKENDIVSPYFSNSDPRLDSNDGVGLFHDRIIFKKNDFDVHNFGDVKKAAIQKTLNQFGLEEHFDYFEQYFLISAIEFEADNPIMGSGKILDCLELSKPFVMSEENNPLLTLYTSDDEKYKVSRNSNIVKRINNMGIEKWQLFNSSHDGVRDLKSIAGGTVLKKQRKKFKKYKYYAVVRSDGDNMSSIISTLKSDKEIREFSEICLDYCSEISGVVHNEFNGVTIYSGGDDLLALLPIENGDSKTIFDFVSRTNEVFNKRFSGFQYKNVSLSFGIFVSYYKYPLYEALENSAYLLFDNAKKCKNSIAIHFQKHAGQSEGLLISNNSLDGLIQFHNKIVKGIINGEEEIFLSAMHKLNLFKTIFNSTEDLKETEIIFNNIFDSYVHEGNSFVKSEMPKFFSMLKTQFEIFPITEKGAELNSEDYVLTMSCVLRIIKFFIEEGEQ